MVRISLFGLTAALAWVVLPGIAAAQTQRRSEDIVVTAPGDDNDTDDATIVSAQELSRGGTADLLGALNRSVAGVSLSDAQSNPFQPDFVYRGFVASSLQGQAQGLAFYVDGARFNQPFGDTVNFDLLPENAIRSVTIKDASAIYGLNALGGAVVIATKTGRSDPGTSLTGAGGDHGRARFSGEIGTASGPWSAYVALDEQHDSGWRRFSPSTLYNGYADIGWDRASAGLHAKLIAADTDLTGNGSAPVELLAADRDAVYTWPDNTRNRYVRASLHPWIGLGSRAVLQASLYVDRLKQDTVNGDAADIEGCDDTSGVLCLESDDGSEALLADTSGAVIAETLGREGYGVLNRGATDSRGGGALVQLIDTRPLFGGTNRLAVGFSHDLSRTAFAASTELGFITETRGVDSLGPTIDQADGAITPVSVVTRTRDTGMFASDTLPLGPHLSAELGLRWNEAGIDLDDRLGTAVTGRHRFRRLDPAIEFDYAGSKALSLRAGYSEANRAPTPAELACADPAAPCSLTNFFVGDPPLKQVVAKSWETGASGHIAGAWTVDWLLSAWSTTNHDDIQYVAAGSRGRAYFRNIGETRRQGLELDVTAARGPFRLRAGYAFTDATFRTPLTLNSPDNPSAADDGTIQAEPGDRLPGVPRHRIVLSGDYDGGGFSLGADVCAQSGQVFTGDESNDEPTTHAFADVDLRGSIKLGSGLSLFADVSNLLDQHYATFGTFTEIDQVPLVEAPNASDPRSVGPGAPRRWLAGITWRL